MKPISLPPDRMSAKCCGLKPMPGDVGSVDARSMVRFRRSAWDHWISLPLAGGGISERAERIASCERGSALDRLRASPSPSGSSSRRRCPWRHISRHCPGNRPWRCRRRWCRGRRRSRSFRPARRRSSCSLSAFCAVAGRGDDGKGGGEGAGKGGGGEFGVHGYPPELKGDWRATPRGFGAGRTTRLVLSFASHPGRVTRSHSCVWRRRPAPSKSRRHRNNPPSAPE